MSKIQSCILRVRAVFHKTVLVCYVYCNFKLGFTCRITVIFGTLKDGSLLINTLYKQTNKQNKQKQNKKEKKKKHKQKHEPNKTEIDGIK